MDIADECVDIHAGETLVLVECHGYAFQRVAVLAQEPLDLIGQSEDVGVRKTVVPPQLLDFLCINGLPSSLAWPRTSSSAHNPAKPTAIPARPSS